MWRCGLCDQQFARQFTLERHKKAKHSDVKILHRCGECEETFTRRDHLRRHSYNVHGDGCIACAHCSRAFRRDYLQQHQSRCGRKRKLPGGETIFNTGLRNISTLQPIVGDRETLQQCFQVSLTPNITLQRPEDDCGSLQSTLPAFVSESNSFGPVESEFHQHQSRELVDIGMHDELAMDVYPEIIQSLRQRKPVYDEKGRIRIDAWPSEPCDHPPPPQSLVAAVDDMKQYCPDLNVVASMEPFYFNPVDEAATQSPSWNFVLPARFKLYMLPCVRCNDCHSVHIVLKLEKVYRDFNREHASKHMHRKNLRRRLMPNSRIIQRLAHSINEHDSREAEKWVDRLVVGDISTDELWKTYGHRFSKSILSCAHQNDERDLLAYLLDEHWHAEEEYVVSVVRWARALNDLDVVRMVLYRGYEIILWTREYRLSNIIDEMVVEQGVSEAVALIEFAASHGRCTALVLACECGQDEVIASILQAGADPNPKNEIGDYPMDAALMRAKVGAVRTLLGAGASVEAIGDGWLRFLARAREGGALTEQLLLGRDAAEKLDLLKQNGMYMKHHLYESDDEEFF